MKKLFLKGCHLVSLAVLIPACAMKKKQQPSIASPVPPIAQITQTVPSIPSVAAIQALAPTKTTTQKSPPSPAILDMTTQRGFLGKKDKKTKTETIVKFAKELDKNPGEVNSYHHIKFDIHNVSGTTLYTSCFAYIKPRLFNRWRWRKTDVKEIKAGQKVTIKIRVLNDEQDMKHIFGALGVFSNRHECEESTYELLHDENKLDLDLLKDIENKCVVIGIERYGLREPFYDYDFVDPQQKKVAESTDLDFFVQNQTGNPVFVAGFIYTKKAKGRWIAAEDEKDDMTVWRYYKTKVLKLEPGQTGYVEVDNIIPKRDRSFVRGYLGVFGAEHENEAHRKTFELLSDKEKINLGLLTRRRGRTIILEVESYGVANDIIDYTVKPIKWIDFTKIVR
jgi:hypothetical protein